jgi:hypothetical protein
MRVVAKKHFFLLYEDTMKYDCNYCHFVSLCGNMVMNPTIEIQSRRVFVAQDGRLCQQRCASIDDGLHRVVRFEHFFFNQS